MKTNVKLGTIIRTVCLVLALVNQGLLLAGHSVLPITDEQVNELITLGATVVTSLWAWWKNNSFTPAAIVADEFMHGIKSGTVEWDDEETEE
jgi:SPP1 family holin